MKNYIIKLNEQQLSSIQRALESVARMGLGQADMCVSYAKGANGVPLYDYQISREVEGIIKPLMGLTPNASWGVGKYKDIDTLFDMSEVIRHKLAWDRATESGVTDGTTRKWPNMMQVYYDEPMHWNKEIPQIEVVSV